MEVHADSNVILWVVEGLSLLALSLLALLNKKVDRKVSKEVFQEFKIANAASHKTTHDGQAVQDKKLDKIFDKLDGKQDKPGG